MPLPWIRLDTSMPDHPKILELAALGDRGLAAAFVWSCSLTYAGKHGTEGLITRGALPRVNGQARHAALLVDVRLWDMHPLGWMIHNWAEYQMAIDFDEVFTPQARSNGGRARMAKLTAQERSDLAKRAADARWNGG